MIYLLYLSDILATDPQLAEEIQFDLRRFEEEQKRLQDQCRPTGTAATPLAQMVRLILPDIVIPPTSVI